MTSPGCSLKNAAQNLLNTFTWFMVGASSNLREKRCTQWGMILDSQKSTTTKKITSYELAIEPLAPQAK